jgi:ribose/xylose/arabinose/galactoside ABC-type transport system permease subunit
MERTKILLFIQRAVKNYAMVFIFAGLFILFSIMNPSFCSWMNIKNLIVQNTYIVVTAVGISFVMMSGALDLSIGYQVAAIGVLTARLMTLEQSPVWFAVIVAILFGMALGFLNGGISVLFKIEPLIVTIATMTVFRGIANLISKGLSYNNFPVSFRVITRGSLLGIPVDVYIAILAVAVASIVYNFTYYGRFVKAMGGNEEATRLAGVNIALMRISTFVISGFFVAIASFIYISKLSLTNATYGPGIEFTGMTAAILGGISFNSGEGKMWGLVVGIFTLAIIENGMQLGGLNQYIQYIIKGLILIVAIAFDKYQRNMNTQKKTA